MTSTQPVADTETASAVAAPDCLSGERADLLQSFAKHRGFFLHAVRGVTDEAARTRPTTSELSLGGLAKHVTAMGHQWLGFTRNGPWEAPDIDWESVDWTNPPEEVVRFSEGFTMREDETLEQLVAGFEAWGAELDEAIGTLDLDETHPLPEAPWFEAGAEWTNRRVLLHLLTEIAQHAGHADIIRESIDGQKTMG